MNNLTIYVARHGRTIMNTLLRAQGWCDSPLTSEGVEVAEFLGKGLRGIDLQMVYCSTLNRTHQTAKIILGAKNEGDLPIVVKENFKEGFLGGNESSDEGELWTRIALYLQYVDPNDVNKNIANGKLKYSDIVDVIAKIDPWQVGENWATIEKRTQQALREVAEEEFAKGSKNILIVSHGMAIMAMLLSLGGEKLLKGVLDNASICKVIYDGKDFTVESMGDMSYVERGKTL